MNEQMERYESVESAEQSSGPGLVQRVIAVFTSPTQLGDWLRLSSPWFLVLALVTVVGLVLTFLVPVDLIVAAAKEQIEAGGRPGAAAPSATLLRSFAFGGALLAPLVGALVVAGVLYVIFNLIFGQSETTYKQHLSAVSHVFWISLLGSLITFPLQLAKQDIQLKLGFGLLLPDDPSSFVGYFLAGISLFGLWAAVALGAVESGLSAGKVSLGKAATAIVGLYLVFAALGAALKGLGS